MWKVEGIRQERHPLLQETPANPGSPGKWLLNRRERERGRLKKTWWDCVKNDMGSLGLSQKDAQFRKKWRRRIKGAIGYPDSTLVYLPLIKLPDLLIHQNCKECTHPIIKLLF